MQYLGGREPERLHPKSLDLLPPGQQLVGRTVTVLSSLVRRITGRTRSLMIKKCEWKEIYIELILLKRTVTLGEDILQVDRNVERE